MFRTSTLSLFALAFGLSSAFASAPPPPKIEGGDYFQAAYNQKWDRQRFWISPYDEPPRIEGADDLIGDVAYMGGGDLVGGNHFLTFSQRDGALFAEILQCRFERKGDVPPYGHYEIEARTSRRILATPGGTFWLGSSDPKGTAVETFLAPRGKVIQFAKASVKAKLEAWFEAVRSGDFEAARGHYPADDVDLEAVQAALQESSQVFFITKSYAESGGQSKTELFAIWKGSPKFQMVVETNDQGVEVKQIRMQ